MCMKFGSGGWRQDGQRKDRTVGFLKGQKAGETEGICRKLLNILQSKEG